MLIHSQDKATIKNTLKMMTLFSQLKDDVVARLSEHALQRFEKKGSILFLPDMPNDKFYIVISGWVKLFRETMDGAEAVIDVLTSSHYFGEIGLSGADSMPYGAEIIEDAEIISLPRFLLEEEVIRNSVFGLSVLRHLTQKKIQSDMEIEHRTLQSAPQRIGCFLLKLCNQSVERAVTLHLPYDKVMIAGRLGMRPETFSRALTKLREETGIRIKESSIEIDDVQKLISYTCVACSSSFPCN